MGVGGRMDDGGTAGSLVDAISITHPQYLQASELQGGGGHILYSAIHST